MKLPRDLRVPIESLKPGINRLEFELDAREIEGEDREIAENPLLDRLVGPVRVAFDIVRRGRRFMVDGRVRFRAVLNCAVCDSEFSREFTEPLQTEFLEEGALPPPSGKIMDGQDIERLRFRDDRLDLGPLVRDAVHLAIPIAPACRPDCQGYCPDCGANRNENPCDCLPHPVSPFAGLKRMVGPKPGEDQPGG